jgi:hypothetical protein
MERTKKVTIHLKTVFNQSKLTTASRSLLLVHPNGLGSKATNDELNIAFTPTPDYAGIAKAASSGNILAQKVAKAEDLPGVLQKAIHSVLSGVTAVIDAVVVAE